MHVKITNRRLIKTNLYNINQMLFNNKNALKKSFNVESNTREMREHSRSRETYSKFHSKSVSSLNYYEKCKCFAFVVVVVALVVAVVFVFAFIGSFQGNFEAMALALSCRLAFGLSSNNSNSLGQSFACWLSVSLTPSALVAVVVAVAVVAGPIIVRYIFWTAQRCPSER